MQKSLKSVNPSFTNAEILILLYTFYSHIIAFPSLFASHDVSKLNEISVGIRGLHFTIAGFRGLVPLSWYN